MKIQPTAPDASILEILGERFLQYRLSQNLTQGQIAEQAGVGLRTVQRLESGEGALQLSSFIRVCRVLGLIERLDALLPEPAASPIEQLRRQGRKRQRASRRPAAEPWPDGVHESAPAPVPKKWQWGEPS